MANAEGTSGIGNDLFSISLNGDLDILTAGANAGGTAEDQFGARAEASASVVAAEGSVVINILGFEIELGANADVITAGAKAEVGIFRNEDGKIKFQNKSKAGFGWFGWGLNLGITLPF